MNMFWLDSDLTKAAEYHVDKHVVKMITEYSQILNSVYYFTDESDKVAMGLFNPNHPCMIWVRHSLDNWLTLQQLGICLYAEYHYRYGFDRVHRSGEILTYIEKPSLPYKGFSDPPLCMPDDCKIVGDTVNSYRLYYSKYKSNLFSWRNREQPYWIL